MLSGPWKNLPEMAPNGARSFFPTKPDLADILGDMEFGLDDFSVLDVFGFQIMDFPTLQNLESFDPNKSKNKNSQNQIHVAQNVGKV